jgi:hypothetical protein
MTFFSQSYHFSFLFFDTVFVLFRTFKIYKIIICYLNKIYISTQSHHYDMRIKYFASFLTSQLNFELSKSINMKNNTAWIKL